MKILIVKTSALGDIVHTFPALGYLKEKFPQASIDWVVEKSCSSLVSAHPAIDRTLTIDTKHWRKNFFSSATMSEIPSSISKLRQTYYDVIFDLQGNVKSGLVTALAKGHAKVGFSKDSVAEWPNVLFTNKRFSTPADLDVRSIYLHLVQSYFADLHCYHAPSVPLKIVEDEQPQLTFLLNDLKKKSMPLVMVSHASNWKNKQLTAQSLCAFLKLVQGHLKCFFVFSWGSEAEKKEAASMQQQFEQSVLLEKVSLPVLQRIMAHMHLVIAMDSLPLHLAASTATSTFSIFGPSLAKMYAPIGPQHVFFQGSCPYDRTFTKRCPILRTCPTGACMRDLTGNELFEIFKSCVTAFDS